MLFERVNTITLIIYSIFLLLYHQLPPVSQDCVSFSLYLVVDGYFGIGAENGCVAESVDGSCAGDEWVTESLVESS